jgi:NAD-specific glutamate dehydrogenase
MASNNIDYSATLSSLRSQQAQHPLSILALAEPITASQAQAQSQSDVNLLTSNAQPQPRPSDASSSHNASELEGGGGQLTPSSLSADLAHYKDLFAKLRFSYLEQVTKEKYLRSIVGDPPLVVTHDDNLELEARLAVMKQELKAKKEGVEVLVRDMEAQAQDLAGVYEDVQRGMGVLESVPVEVDRLREQVEALRREVAEKRAGTSTMTEEQRRERDDPRMNISLEATRQALAEQTSHTKEIEGQIAALQRELPGKMERMEAVDRELAELDRRRNESARLAGEERKRKEMGGRDEVEELARWYRSQEVVFRGLGLGVEG